MFEMDHDPEVHRYLSQKGLQTKEEVAAVIDYVRQQYADFGIGRWAVIDKETDSFIGWTGFKMMKEETNGHIDYYDFGYRFARKAWGKGIGTEAAKASLDYGIRELGLKPICAMTDPENKASRRILEKLGFRFIELFQFERPTGWRPPNNQVATWYELPEEAMGGNTEAEK
jgi:RimJ/RimL family protein N-acetyltransferase